METPVVLFVFKRKETILKIIEQLKKVQPPKLYIISDQGKNAEERMMVESVRTSIDQAIDWECTVIHDYAEDNRGVFDNIGLGALRVFENEERAIFLEDDNFPELSFFQYCEELLNIYENCPDVLWICGTNYFQTIEGGRNYYFTQNLLPCGWASWGTKFRQHYDKDLKLLDDKSAMRRFKNSYIHHSLYKQQLRDILDEKNRKLSGKRYSSWDYHMLLSIRAQNLYGIMPANNQIRNIGNDIHSIHGGTSMENIMTSRFCQVETKPFEFPITKREILKDLQVERKIEDRILYPFSLRLRIYLNRMIKKMLRIPFDASLKDLMRKERRGND